MARNAALPKRLLLGSVLSGNLGGMQAQFRRSGVTFHSFDRLIRAVRRANSCEAIPLQRCHVTVLVNLCTDRPPV